MPDGLTIVSPTFHPEKIGTPHYVTDMAQWFADRGWPVQVVTGQPFYPRFERYPGYGTRTRHDRLGSIPILRVPTFVPPGGRTPGRVVNEANFALQGILRAPGHRNDAVVSVSPGSPWTVRVGRALRRRGGTHVALVHDVQSGLADALGMGHPRLARLLRANERASLQSADRVAVLTEEMGTAVRRLGVTRPIDVVPLWASIEPPDLQPLDPGFSVQYSGNFGEKQSVVELLDLAAQLDALLPGCRLVLRGDGERFERVRAEAQRRRLAMIDFEAPVEHADLAMALAKSPVHVVMQASGSSPYVMPSKVVNALASGARVVVSTDADSPLVSLARRIDGLTIVHTSRTDDVATAAVKLLLTPEPLEMRAQRVAAIQRQFSRDVSLTHLEQLLLTKV